MNTTTATVTTATIGPGMILVSRWGSEQTNVDFYLVTRSTERSVWMHPIGQAVERATDSMTEYVVPAPEQTTGPEVRRRILTSTRGPLVRSVAGAFATPWDGEPRRQSYYA